MAGTDLDPDGRPGARDGRRIVVLNLDSASSCGALRPLFERFHDRIACVYVSIRPRTGLRRPKSAAARKLRHAGPAFTLYVLFYLFAYRPLVLLSRIIHRRSRRRHFTTDELCRMYSVPIRRAGDVNKPEIVTEIAALDPDLIVSASFDQVIRQPIIDLPRHGVLNVHPSLLPELRGPFPAFWAVHGGTDPVGASVHLVTDESLDTGPVIAQRTAPRIARESVLALDSRLSRLGIALAIDAIEAMSRGETRAAAQDDFPGSYRSFPRRQDVKQLRRQGGRLMRLSDIVALLR